MRDFARRATAIAIAWACASSITARAHADERARPSDETRPHDVDVIYSVDPTALTYLRITGSVEVSIAPHQSIVVSPILDGGSSATAYIADVAYRVYTRDRDPRGPFIGVAAFAGTIKYATPSGPERLGAYVVGAGVDVGWQWIIGPGFAVTAAIGLQVQHSSVPASGPMRADSYDTDVPIFEGTVSGVAPRLHFNLGWGF